MHRADVSCDVVIIGAGAAGLAAALRLTDASRDVVVVEARDRPGGRAWSIDAPDLSDPVEIGPEFVHGHPEVSLRLLARYGVACMPTSEQTFVMVDGHGSLENEDANPRVADLMQRAHAALPLDRDEALLPAIERVARADEREIVEAISSMAKGFDAADPDDVSFRAIHEEWTGDASLSTASNRVVGGYRSLWRALVADISAGGAQLLLSTRVEVVTYSSTGVVIETVDADGRRRIAARSCIVTLPLGVLQRSDDAGGVRFEPALPPQRREAFHALAMGSVVKAHAFFEQPFWAELDDGRYRDAAFFRAPRGAAFPTFWTTEPRKSGLLTAWAGGSDVKGDLLGDNEVIRAALFASIDATFGLEAGLRARELLRWLHRWDWQRDAWSFGAYSYARVNGIAAREVLLEPLHNRLYFAGEAYAPNGEAGTVAGALERGESAANALLG